MKKKHERSIIDAFSNYFLSQGREYGRQTYRLSVDGQDSLLGADYIFTSNSKFALIEFKYESKDILAESKKELREEMCILLDQSPPRLRQSLECHYIAWSELTETRKVHFNMYHPEVCNSKIFQDSKILAPRPKTDCRLRAEELVDQFLNGTIGSEYETFSNYTQWLLRIAGSEGGSIEVMLDNPDSNQLDILDFKSLDLLNDWLINNRPKPKPEFKFPSPF